MKRKFGVQDAQLKKIQEELDRSKNSGLEGGFNDILGLGTSSAYRLNENHWERKEQELENKISVIKNQLSRLETNKGRCEEPKDGRVKFASLAFQDMDDAVAFVTANRECLHFVTSIY